MKTDTISVLVSKKLGQNFNSWSVSYGVTGQLEEGEEFKNVLQETDMELRTLIKEQLPTPDAVKLRLAKANAKK